ncbi:MAG: DUF5686 family protein [Bacteroidales bacterium]|nr:DUF5686 family protein [Bacteroidales bacterium]
MMTFFAGRADTYFVRGIVRDSVTDEPLPYASVVVSDAKTASVTDKNGIFEMAVPDRARALQITCVGYEKKLLPIHRGQLNTYAVYLSPSTTELNEVVVHRSKYSKKNNPAVEFARRLKESGPLTDPERNPYYAYDKYERISLGINNFTAEEKRNMLSRFPFLIEHVDTSDISGKPVLGLMVKEKSSRVSRRRSPSAYKEIVSGERSQGIDEIIDQASMRTLIEDVMREIDLYQSDINLLQNRFVSPLSPIAPDFYKFYLTDTVTVGDERCIVLSFYPRNHAAFGFMGHVYVPEGDSTMFIRKVEMHLPREINLNFVDNLYISQSFERSADGSRLKVLDDLTVEMSVLGKSNGLYMRRNSAYDNHSFEAISDSVFSGDGNVAVEPGARERDEEFWQHVRLTAMPKGESRVGELMARLRKVPLYYWSEKVLKILFSSYVATGSPSKFDIGPVNAMMSFNSVEGTRLRFGGMTTAELSRRWFARGFAAYGFKDHRWKYKAELEYSFIDKDYHSREFPVQSVRLTSSYDIDRPGQHYLFTSPDNIVLSLKRESDDRITYQRLNKLEFIFETRSNFTVTAAVANDCQEASRYMPFVDGYGNRIARFTENTLEVSLRYAPGEKFFQGRTHRIPVNLDAPAITLMHTFAPRGFLGSKYEVNKTEIDIQKRFWMSAFGYLDVYVGGGHVWSRSSYLNLLIPNANLSYIIQPRSFALMNPMEFVNSSYASFDLTYWANGAILNYVPLIKKLKLREVFGFRGYWGHLSDRCNPADNPELLQFPEGAGIVKLNHGPYMEASVGIENIFKVLRVDYVWRLNYRDVPYEIDRSGVRIAVHVTF